MGKPSGWLSCRIIRSTRLVVLPHSAVCECNYRAENDGVECGAFCRFGRGVCPETPHGFLWRSRPETPRLALISLTSRRNQERMSDLAIQVKNPELQQYGEPEQKEGENANPFCRRRGRH